LAAPAERSGCTDRPGTNMASTSSKRSRPRDCENRFTTGFQPPDIRRQSQASACGSPPPRLPSARKGDTHARRMRRLPSVPTTAEPRRMRMPSWAAACGSSPSAFPRRSTTASTVIPAFAASMAAA
jgi:hypothetical protein